MKNVMCILAMAVSAVALGDEQGIPQIDQAAAFLKGLADGIPMEGLLFVLGTPILGTIAEWILRKYPSAKPQSLFYAVGNALKLVKKVAEGLVKMIVAFIALTDRAAQFLDKIVPQKLKEPAPAAKPPEVPK